MTSFGSLWAITRGPPKLVSCSTTLTPSPNFWPALYDNMTRNPEHLTRRPRDSEKIAVWNHRSSTPLGPLPKRRAFMKMFIQLQNQLLKSDSCTKVQRKFQVIVMTNLCQGNVLTILSIPPQKSATFYKPLTLYLMLHWMIKYKYRNQQAKNCKKSDDRRPDGPTDEPTHSDL